MVIAGAGLDRLLTVLAVKSAMLYGGMMTNGRGREEGPRGVWTVCERAGVVTGSGGGAKNAKKLPALTWTDPSTGGPIDQRRAVMLQRTTYVQRGISPDGQPGRNSLESTIFHPHRPPHAFPFFLIEMQAFHTGAGLM